MITIPKAIRNDTVPILPLDQRVILENVIISRTCPTCDDTGWVWWWEDGGGDILDQVLARIRRHARIVICGAISQYNATAAMQGPKNYLALLVHRARMEGMVVFDYADRYPMAVSELAGHLRSGRMKSREDIVEGGIDAFPEALLRLFRGENFGKLVLRVASD